MNEDHHSNHRVTANDADPRVNVLGLLHGSIMVTYYRLAAGTVPWGWECSAPRTIASLMSLYGSDLHALNSGSSKACPSAKVIETKVQDCAANISSPLCVRHQIARFPEVGHTHREIITDLQCRILVPGRSGSSRFQVVSLRRALSLSVRGRPAVAVVNRPILLVSEVSTIEEKCLLAWANAGESEI